MALAPGIAEALFDIVKREHVLLGSDLARSPRPGKPSQVSADAVVFPRSTAEVADVVRGAAVCGIPTTVVPSWIRHDKQWLNADGIVVALHRMNRIITIDRELGLARVQPGVSVPRLLAVARAAGLPESTAGSNGAVGTAEVRYVGQWLGCDRHRHDVREAELVSGAGQVTRWHAQAADGRSNPWPPLPSGLKECFPVITELTLSLTTDLLALSG